MDFMEAPSAPKSSFGFMASSSKVEDPFGAFPSTKPSFPATDYRVITSLMDLNGCVSTDSFLN